CLSPLGQIPSPYSCPSYVQLPSDAWRGQLYHFIQYIYSGICDWLSYGYWASEVPFNRRLVGATAHHRLGRAVLINQSDCRFLAPPILQVFPGQRLAADHQGPGKLSRVLVPSL